MSDVKEEILDNNYSIQEDEKTFRRNKWFFTTGGIGRDMLYTLVSTYFLTYVQYGMTLTIPQFTTLSLLIGILGRIWDGINDPMMGAIIEGTHMKWGKYKPWIFIGAIADALLTIALFNIRPTGWTYVAVICAVYLLWEATFTMNDIGYWSMIPSLSRTKERRDKITTLTIFFAGIGTIIMTAMVTYLQPGNMLNAYTMFSIIACIAVIGCQTMTTFGVKEAEVDESSKEEKVSLKRMVKTIVSNKQLLWMSLAELCSGAAQGVLLGLIYNLYYYEVGYDSNVFFFLIVYAVANTLLQLVYPPIAKKFGRKKIQLYSFIVEAIGYVGLALCGWWPNILPLNLLTLCIFGVLIFAGNTPFYTASVININNCVEYNEYLTGKREEAVVTTMRPLIVKFADAIKYAVVTLTITLSGLFAITSNISSMETQVGTFKEYVTKSVDNKEEALEYVKEYYSILDQIELDEGYGVTFDDEYYESLNAIIDKNENNEYYLLKECKFDTTYYYAVGTMFLTQYSKKNANDTSYKVFESAIQLISYDKNDSTGKYDRLLTDESLFKDDCKYVFNISYSEETSDGTKVSGNSGTVIFSQNRNMKVRLALRASCTILPLALMFFSLIIQRKKFFIDEEYFDFLLKENEKRNKEKE